MSKAQTKLQNDDDEKCVGYVCALRALVIFAFNHTHCHVPAGVQLRCNHMQPQKHLNIATQP